VSAFIDEHRGRFGVEPICRTVDVSASAYYQRASGQRSARAIEDDRSLGRIREVHAANYDAYGYLRMWKALLRAGERAPRCRVQRLMRTHAIHGAKRRGRPWRTTRPDAHAKRRPDLVRRDFAASAPDRLWVADLSYLRCWEGLVFFAFVIDAFSRRVVGWQLALHMRTTLVLDALRMALGQRAPGADVALVHHSERGSQYTSIDYTQTLTDHGVLASVGSATPTTTRWPNRSSTASRPNSSATASGRPERSSSWRSSSGSPGSTTSVSTRRSVIVPRPRWRPSTLPGSF
jgi:putative transposase